MMTNAQSPRKPGMRTWIFALLTVELALLAFHFVSAMRVQAPVTLTGGDLVPLNDNAFIDEFGGLALQDSSDYGAYAETPNILLKKGTYTVTVDYQSTLAGGTVVQDNFLVTCNDLSLKTNSRTSTFKMWVRGNTGTSFDFTYNGGFRTIYRITVSPTRGYARTSTLLWAFWLAVFDLFVLVWQGVVRLPRALAGKRQLVLGLSMLLLFSTLPLFTGYMLGGDDLCYHMSRLLGLADGLKAGLFPVKIYPTLLNGNGYANGVFYGDFLLYPFAALILIGFKAPDVYLLYTFLTCLATLLVSWFCFQKIFRDEQTAFLGTAAYMLANYRLTDLFTRDSVGEFTAFLFFPLILYSLWAIFTDDVHAPGYRRHWIPGAVGYAGLILCHLLSCEIAALFTILTCLVFIRKVLRKETFRALAQIVLAATAATLWFLVPLLDYMFTDTFRINTDAAWNVFLPLSNCTFLPQLFEVFLDAAHMSYNLVHGMPGDMALSLGGALVFGMALLVWLLVERTDKSPERRAGVFFLGMGVLAAWMTSTLFPWYELSEICGAVTVFLTRMQFPWRFLCAAVVFLSFATASAFQLLKKSHRDLFRLCAVSFAVVTLLSTSYFYHQILSSAGPARFYDLSDLDGGPTQVSLGEYIFPNVLPADVWEHDYVDYDSQTVTVDSYVKGDLSAVFHAENASDAEKTVSVPLLCYKGYRAIDSAGNTLDVSRSKKYGQVTVTLPAGYSGDITVRFVEPWYWRAAEVLSLVFVLAMAGLWLLRRRKRRASQSGATIL